MSPLAQAGEANKDQTGPTGARPPGERLRDRVLLLSLPFGALERPALALGLLQTHCQRLGIACETRYLTFSFAEQIGLGNYLWLYSDEVPYTAFAGEWLFCETLYGARPYSDAAYVDEILRRTWCLSESDIARLWQIRALTEPFIDWCMRNVRWSDYTLIGFTSVFQQNLASLALAARIKRNHPDITIAFGGANWEESMGCALQDQFPFVDLVFSGEADESFPAILEARRDGNDFLAIRGIRFGERIRRAELTPAERVKDLDAVPIPDFEPFFQQMQASPAARGITPTLLMETARGCWWGERSHCTFCGLNGATMAFRSKTPARVLSEIQLLVQRYGVRMFSVVDDILDMRYFQSVLPDLVAAKTGAEFFWETKANLTRAQVRLLRDAGVLSIQPGIESLSDHVLQLMKKGTTAFRNIELMKWCCEYGVKPFWNLLYGFPGETAADYEESSRYIRSIWHLQPPTGYGPVRMDRFSPYHTHAAEFGMVNVQPMAPFTYLYPFERRALMKIAYYFDFTYADGRAEDEFAASTVELTRAWMADASRGMLEIRREANGSLQILDTRRDLQATPQRAILQGWKAAAYIACDRSQNLQSLLTTPEIQHASISEGELRAFLERCVKHELMVSNERSWLAVAVHVPAREEYEGHATLGT